MMCKLHQAGMLVGINTSRRSNSWATCTPISMNLF